MRLSDSLPGGILTVEQSFPSKNADFMTLMHTIVYRINDAFNKIRSKKQMVPVESVRPPPKALYVILSPPHAGEESL